MIFKKYKNIWCYYLAKQLNQICIFWLVVSRRYILTCCISLNLFHDLWILFDLWIRTLIIFTNIVWKFNQFLNIYVYSKISNTTLWWFIPWETVDSNLHWECISSLVALSRTSPIIFESFFICDYESEIWSPSQT